MTPSPAPLQREISDVGNGERLVDRFGDDLRYLAVQKTWMVFTGERFEPDRTRAVEAMAKTVIREMAAHALSLTDDEARTRLLKHALLSEKDSNVRAMVRRAEAERGLVAVPEQFDADPNLFNVKNGTLDLSTGDLRPHRRADLLTKLSPVEWSDTAECPTWLSFLDRIFASDAQLIDYVQRGLGYTMTGCVDEQCLHLGLGTGANGKSTTFEVVAYVFGSYGGTADFSALLERKNDGPRNDIARLAGLRLVRSAEVGEGRRLNEPLIKSLTGSEQIAARFLYSETFEFLPQFKLWLTANHRPEIRGTDPAIWRRVRLIPFSVTIPEEERDPTLKSRLIAEAPGILRWLVEGCLRWRRVGLVPPPIVQVATEEYKTGSDIIGAFLEECCDAGAYTCQASALYQSYRQWCTDAGESPATATAFGRQLQERGFDVFKSGVKYRHGLRIKPSMGSRTPDRGWADTSDGSDTYPGSSSYARI